MDHNKWKTRIHEIIFEADTPEGKLFDVALLWLILASVVVVLLDSMPNIHAEYGNLLYAFEWGFTIIFTIEYALRIYSVIDSKKYIFSFFGIIDLLSVLPTFLSLILVGSQSLIVIRSLRLLRVFRIFNLSNFTRQSREILVSLRNSRTKIFVFLSFILVLVTIIGAIMYLVEHKVNPEYDSIPRSIYWTIVTLTTVGYGDITPVTNLGQFLSAIIMLLGYAIIVIPTGIVSSELIRGGRLLPTSDNHNANVSCRYCSAEGHQYDAVYCKYCGHKL